MYLASLLERKVPLVRGEVSGKKHGFSVTSSEVAQAYHLLHQINMTGIVKSFRFCIDQISLSLPLSLPLSLSSPFSPSPTSPPLPYVAPGAGSHLKGLGLYLSLSALNFAETDRPMKRLPGPIVSEMYFSLSLQSSVSIPYLSSFAMVRLCM